MKSESSKKQRPRCAEKTEKDLEAAFLQLKSQGKKISAQAVADIVGVDRSLIPKRYERIHQLIVKAQGREPAQKLGAVSDEMKKLKRLLKETEEAREISDKQVQDLASINATLEERLKDQTRALEESARATQPSELVAERDALARENQELKVWVAELQAQLQGKLVGRIGQSQHGAKP